MACSTDNNNPYPGYGTPPRRSWLRIAAWQLLTFAIGVLWFILFYVFFPTGVLLYLGTTIFGCVLWKDVTKWAGRRGWFCKRSPRKGKQ